MALPASAAASVSVEKSMFKYNALIDLACRYVRGAKSAKSRRLKDGRAEQRRYVLPSPGDTRVTMTAVVRKARAFMLANSGLMSENERKRQSRRGREPRCIIGWRGGKKIPRFRARELAVEFVSTVALRRALARTRPDRGVYSTGLQFRLSPTALRAHRRRRRTKAPRGIGRTRCGRRLSCIVLQRRKGLQVEGI